MGNEEQAFYPKDFEYLHLLNPNKMSIDEIVNYINSCSNGSDRMFIYNAYYFMLKVIPDKPVVADTERAFSDPKIKEGAKRYLITTFKASSAYCDVWLSPQEKFMNYLGNLWQVFFSKIKPRKYDYAGYVDMISKQEILGWVINQVNPKERVMVDVFGDGEKKLSVCADGYREDLKLNRVGDGLHAIYIKPLPEELLKCSNIQLRTQNDNTLLKDNMLGIIRPVYNYVGFIDIISRQEILGWVFNQADQEERVIVDIYGDGEKKLSICADVYREDLKLSGVGDGFHTIHIKPVPEELLKCSVITIKTKNQGILLTDRGQEGRFVDA